MQATYFPRYRDLPPRKAKPSVNDPKTWLTAHEAAIWLHITTKRFNRLVADGYLPNGVKVGGVPVYCPKGIRAAIQHVPVGLMQPVLS